MRTGVFATLCVLLISCSGEQVPTNTGVYMLLSVLGMLPLMVVGERKGHLKEAFLGAILLLAVSQALMGRAVGAVGFYLGLWLFFVGFNYLEATLPSLVSKTVHAGSRGTALGVYSSFQFLGAFAGGAVGGLTLQVWGEGAVFLLCLVLSLLWLLAILGMRSPRKLTDLVLQLPADESQWDERLLLLRGAAGVEELLLLREQRTVHLKIDEAVFDRTLVVEAGAG